MEGPLFAKSFFRKFVLLFGLAQNGREGAQGALGAQGDPIFPLYRAPLGPKGPKGPPYGGPPIPWSWGLAAG